MYHFWMRLEFVRFFDELIESQKLLNKTKHNWKKAKFLNELIIGKSETNYWINTTLLHKHHNTEIFEWKINCCMKLLKKMNIKNKSIKWNIDYKETRTEFCYTYFAFALIETIGFLYDNESSNKNILAITNLGSIEGLKIVLPETVNLHG